VIAFLIISIIHRIFKIANRSENPVFYLFCVGIASMIGFQFLMNALGISGVMPIKGITVPFISYGGSSLLSLSIAIGMVLMISKKAKM
jgi:cell division protein FtsW